MAFKFNFIVDDVKQKSCSEEFAVDKGKLCGNMTFIIRVSDNKWVDSYILFKLTPGWRIVQNKSSGSPVPRFIWCYADSQVNWGYNSWSEKKQRRGRGTDPRPRVWTPLKQNRREE